MRSTFGNHSVFFLLVFTVTTQAFIDQKEKQLFAHEFNNGLRLMEQNQYDAARQAFEKATQYKADCAEAYFNIGIIYIKQNNINDAISAFEKSIICDPTFTKAYLNLTALYKEQTNTEKTIWAYRKLIELQPEYEDDFYLPLARTLKGQGKINDALDCYRKATEKKPQDLNLKLEAGNLCCTTGHLDEALTLYREIITQNPGAYPVFGNIGHVLRYQGNFKQAIHYYNQIHKLRPDDEHIRYGLAESYLALGDFQNGWEYFSSHWKRGPDTRNFSEKYWDGSDVTSKKILLRAEYGQGDTIQFIRYAQPLKEQGAYIIAEVQHSLVPLLQLCPYLDEVIPIKEQTNLLPEFDVQVPIMNLPHLFKTTLSTIPAQVPYLEADSELVQFWSDKIAHDTQFKVGICWQASSYYESFKAPQQKKSLALEQFIPLFKLQNVSVYNLQVLSDHEEINSLPADVQLHVYDDFDNSHGRFMDTAALIKNLDLILTIDTSVTHLAGALGKPVWVLLPQSADWRWMQNRNDCPWYPNMRLFRQTEIGNWNSVIQEVVQELKKIIEPHQQESVAPTNQPVFAEVSFGELLDKITILQIKNERIENEEKLQNIRIELETLEKTFNTIAKTSPELKKLINELREANKKLWGIEDNIREKEQAQTFDTEFIQLARGIYFTNDWRCEVKRTINKLLGSRLIEEKSYTDYFAPTHTS